MAGTPRNITRRQKTGCRIEDMQFTTTDRLEPAIALLSVVAVTLLNLREAARRPDADTRRADTRGVERLRRGVEPEALRFGP